MALAVGATLGPFDIVVPIGAGGMATSIVVNDKVVLLFNVFDELNRLLPVKK